MDKTDTHIISGYHALGTLWYIEVFDSVTEEKRREMKSYFEGMLSDFGKKYSRFYPKSLLNDLNYNKSIPYDDDLYQMVSLGETFYKETCGVFDLFIKKDLEKKGYGHVERDETVYVVDEALPRIYTSQGYLYLNSDKQIDLGGIGKGYCIDIIAQQLQEIFDVRYFLINGGGDMYVTSDHNKPILLYLEHPTDATLSIGSVPLQNQSLCVSSSFKRSWNVGDTTHNHFIASGNGTERHVIAASYVVGETAVVADVIATCMCIVAHSQEAVMSIADTYSVQYCVINEEGNVMHSSLFSHVIQLR
ncbi:MAG: hypothetical protein RLZZ308_314 [Candidatus Parcubacteria bacterium]